MIKRIYIEITNRCNLRCGFCHFHHREYHDMTLEEFQMILKQVKPITPFVYLHVQGEPLLHPHFEEFLCLLDKENFQVQLVTNGALLYRYPHLTEHTCIRKLSVSLHSLDYQTIPLETYLQPILALLNNTKAYIELRFWTGETASKNTLEALKYLQQHYAFELTSKKDSYQISEKVYVHFDHPFEWPSDAKQDSTIGTCLGAKQMIGILSDLTVVPCCLDAEGTIALGNLKNQTIDEILHSSRYLNMVNGFNNRKITEELCKQCSYRNRFNKQK